MPLSAATDDFHPVYDRHGTPGAPPDLRGFGQSDKHDRDPAEHYGAAAQARSAAGQLTELDLSDVVVAGYDVGSRVSPQLADDRLDHLTAAYSPPGAFVASIGWYRAGGGVVARSLAETVPAPEDRIAVPTTILWPEHDPLFPRAWSDRVGEFFTDVAVTDVDGVGHFVPVEAPREFAAAVATAATR